MSTPTKAFVNWSSVTATPAGGSLITCKNVMSVSLPQSTNQLMLYGDARRFASAIGNVEQSVGMSITTTDIAFAAALSYNTTYTLTAVLNDLVNGAAAGGGAIQWTLVNAALKSNGISATNNQLGSVTIEFTAYATSDVNPLSSVAV
jgi:hypothetical protein